MKLLIGRPQEVWSPCTMPTWMPKEAEKEVAEWAPATLASSGPSQYRGPGEAWPSGRDQVLSPFDLLLVPLVETMTRGLDRRAERRDKQRTGGTRLHGMERVYGRPRSNASFGGLP